VSRVFRSGNTGPGASPRGAAPPSPGRLRVGPTLAVMVRNASQPSQERVRGASLGLPADGPGSLATFQSRVGAFLVDAVGAAFVAGLLTAPGLPGNWSLVAFVVVTIVSLAAFGQTPGMRLVGLRLAHPRQGERLALWRAVIRTALLCLLVPALLVDADGRGLHDRLTGTAVVRD
jgi:RDD family